MRHALLRRKHELRNTKLSRTGLSRVYVLHLTAAAKQSHRKSERTFCGGMQRRQYNNRARCGVSVNISSTAAAVPNPGPGETTGRDLPGGNRTGVLARGRQVPSQPSAGDASLARCLAEPFLLPQDGGAERELGRQLQWIVAWAGVEYFGIPSTVRITEAFPLSFPDQKESRSSR